MCSLSNTQKRTQCLGFFFFVNLEMSVFLLRCESWQPSVGCGTESIPLHSWTEGPLPSHFLYYTRSLSANCRHALLTCPCIPCSRKTKIPLPLPRLDSTLKVPASCCSSYADSTYCPVPRVLCTSRSRWLPTQYCA